MKIPIIKLLKQLRYEFSIVLLIIGVFLIIDSFFIHFIVFDYEIFGLQFLDTFIDHWMIGVVLISVALIVLTKISKKIIIPSVVIILLAGFLITPVPMCYVPTKILTNVTAEYTEEEISGLHKQEKIVFYTLGKSMLPTITGDMSCVCIKKQTYQIGDIVTFHVDMGEYYKAITHRIIRIEDGYYVPKGDNNPIEDVWRLLDEHVVCHIPQVPRILLPFYNL